MIDILEKIKTYKLEEIKKMKSKHTIDALEARAVAQTPCRGFRERLKFTEISSYAIIGEIKKASPSKGIIRDNFNVQKLATAYEQGGASCLSVLTDYPSFKGKPEFLSEARKASTLPILRKDFLYDPYQVVESRAIGADCILIIMASVSDKQAEELETTAFSLNMDVLLEVHNELELTRAMKLKSKLIGINNRDLKTFQIRLETTERLAPRIPSQYIVISESGLNTKSDLMRMENVNVKSFLIGESLMKKVNVKNAIEELQK